MKKLLLAFCTVTLAFVSFSQSVDSVLANYWQQEVNYKIDAALNTSDHSLKANLSLEYINHSPDKLDFIWFHLWPNAYKNNNTAYAKKLLKAKDGKKRLNEMTQRGFIDGLDFMIDGVKATTEPDPQNIDIIKLVLAKPLQPGDKITITTPFHVKIPTYSSRSGFLDQSYIICQWYPKPAVYDRKGWHPIPYLDQGEFYSEFGSFDVKITVPSSFVIGATGLLQDQTEFATYKQLGTNNNDSTKKVMMYKAQNPKQTKTLEYKADKVHDFAWFADKDFVVRYDSLQLASGKIIDVFTYGSVAGNPTWKKSVSYVKSAITHYSNWIGEYPYPIAQAVEGPKNVMSGGMEYPTITLITSPDAEEPEMDGVIAHEVGHNWFYGILASNERDHAWMDEGMNSYFEFVYEGEKYRANSIFGKMLPDDLKTKPLDEFMALIFNALSQIPTTQPIETPAADFPDDESYATVVYLKTSVWMYIALQSVGAENFDKIIKSYYNDWKFKHPYPEDLQAEFEKQMNMGYDKLFELLKKPGKFE